MLIGGEWPIQVIFVFILNILYIYISGNVVTSFFPLIIFIYIYI